MRILADLHHGQLYKSHELLFEKRLGHELYRPIGRDWYEKYKYWGWTYDEKIIQQFLGHPNLLTQKEYGLGGRGIGKIVTSEINEYHHNLITFDVFLNMEFDILLASLPEHVSVFQNISKIHPSHPKVIFQMGNMWENYPRNVKNILNATNIIIDPSIHSINYYPEFELEYCEENVSYIDKTLSSFIHLNAYHKQNLYYELEQKFKMNIREYGINNKHDFIPDICRCIIKKMLESQFIWHYKCGGEGYGFIIHEAFACGRPPLVNYKEVYCNQRAGELMNPGINCIDVSGKTSFQIMEDIKTAYNKWDEMSLCAKKSFYNKINFDDQSIKLQKFLNDLI